MADANAILGDIKIVIAANGTITLASPLPGVGANLTIVGPGTYQLIISGSNAVQIFSFSTGTTNVVSGLTSSPECQGDGLCKRRRHS